MERHEKTFTTRSAAQRLANKLNSETDSMWVVGHDANTGWFIEDINTNDNDFAVANFKKVIRF